MSRSFAFRGAPAAWLFALALACVPLAPARAADSVPAPAVQSPEAAGAAITPGPPSSRFT